MVEVGEISKSPSGLDVMWRITNFFSLSEENGADHYSPDFSFRGEDWCLVIYPNGWSERDSYGYVDLRLFRFCSDHPIRQAFSLSLKNVQGEKYNEGHFTKDFEGLLLSHGFNRFISRSELSRRQSELVPGGVLTVACSMKNIMSAGSDTGNSENICVEASTQTGEENAKKSENICVETSTQTVEENAENSEIICIEASTQTGEENEDLKQLSIAELKKADTPEVIGSDEAGASGSIQTGATEISPVNLLEELDWVTDVSDFLKESTGIDVTFELETPSGKTEFVGHQLILALRSPYFEDAFYGTERNNGHLRISLKGTDPKAFEQMIRYCYDYKPGLRTIEDACALFKVAFEFKILSLQKLCRTFIRDSKIEAGNVFSVLEVSEQMEDKSLWDMCNKILQDKTRDVMATYELCDITPVMVHAFLNLSNLSLNSEYELIKWIFDWAKVKTEDEDSSSENARGYLERLLKDLDFLALTNEQFALLCKENLHFFSSDEMASIHQNIACPGTRQMPAWYNNNVKCRVYTDSNQ